jgi:CheY-specific phosphatase CheX
MKQGEGFFCQQVADALMAFQISVNMGMWTVETGPLVLDPFVVSTIRMKDNADSGVFIIAFSPETIQKILLSYDIKGNDNMALVNDAAEEVSNMIYGMLKTSLNKMGHHFAMGIPHAITKRRELDTQYRDTEKMILPFLADGQNCRVALAFVPPEHLISS